MASQQPQIRFDTISLSGGMDQVTPTLQLASGIVRDAVNWECSITGGYSRIAGYERFSGKPSPSVASYVAMTVSVSGTLSVGNTVTGATSGATGYVILFDGSLLLMTKLTGSFTVGETLTVGGIAQAIYFASGSPTTVTQILNAQYTSLAAAVYRADIDVVPGSGSIRGVAYFNNTVYAWRDNVGATALNMYKSTAAGWVQVSLGYQLNFTTGLAAGIAEGDTVTGLTSGATGVVTRVVVRDSTFAANDAIGTLMFASVTGTFAAAEALRVSGTTRATCFAAQSAVTLAPGGRIQTVIANFGGSVSSTRMYGCDSVNKAFEFDGTTYVQIESGMVADAPTNIAFHKLHLFLSFGSSVQFSGVGSPYNWSPVFGAGEIALVADVKAFLTQPGDQTTAAMAIYSDATTSILYGSSSADFDLKTFSDGSGSKSYSAQNMSVSYVFDQRGVTTLSATQTYGNFDTASLSLNIRPFIQQRRNLVTASVVNREKSQYRVFFSDGYSLYMTIVNGTLMGAMPVVFPDIVSCACGGESPEGAETSFFGSTNGMVYRLDAGPSFDGVSIDSYFVLTWDSAKSPRTIKRFKKASIEITGSAYAEITLGYKLAYGATDVDLGTVPTNTSVSYWDDANWDDFYWDGSTLSPSEATLYGSGENIAFRVSCNSALFETFTLNSVIMHYTLRRGLR